MSFMPILTSLTLSKLGLVVLRVALGGLKWVTLSLTMNLYIKVVLCMHILFYFVCVCVLFFFWGGWGGFVCTFMHLFLLVLHHFCTIYNSNWASNNKHQLECYLDLSACLLYVIDFKRAEGDEFISSLVLATSIRAEGVHCKLPIVLVGMLEQFYFYFCVNCMHPS